jgi:hypothetical protein
MAAPRQRRRSSVSVRLLEMTTRSHGANDFHHIVRACRLHGTRGMYDLDAIEAINVDQLVTATDRLLFGNVRKRRSSVRARGTADLTLAAKLALVHYASASSPSPHAGAEHTLHVRGASSQGYVAALAAAATLAWLAVAFVCLLA